MFSECAAWFGYFWGDVLVSDCFVVGSVADVVQCVGVLVVEWLYVADDHFGDDGVSHVFAVSTVVAVVSVVGWDGAVSFSFEVVVGDGSDCSYLVDLFLLVFVDTVKWF